MPLFPSVGSFWVWEDFGVGVAGGVGVALGLGEGDSASHAAGRLAGYMQFRSRKGQQFLF